MRSANEVKFLFPEATPLYEEIKQSDSLENIFEDCAIDIMKWIEFRSAKDVKAIYFKLRGEKYRHLEFLGQRLGDGEWALIFFEQEKRALLIRRETQFQRIIDRHEIDSALAL